MKRAQYFNERYVDRVVADRELSKGWLIHFEVISIKTRSQVACHDIPLPELDFFIRACESYAGDAIQIPISLSRDCRFFSVLRNIYHVIPNKRGTGIVHTSESLPLDTILQDLLRRHKDASNITFADFHRTKQTYRQIPLFWIYFDEQSQHLCYAEQKRHEPCKFMVFSIASGLDQKGAPRLHISPAAQRKAQTRDLAQQYSATSVQDEKEFGLCFHPPLPLIAFTSSMSTRVWDFSTSESWSRLRYPRIFMFQLNCLGADKIYKIGSGVRNVIRMTYSSTGDSCIIEPLGSLPNILQVPLWVQKELKAQSNTEAETPQSSQPCEPSTSRALLKPEGETSNYELIENRVALSGSNLFKRSSQGQDSDLSHVSITNNGTAVSLTQWNSTNPDDDGGTVSKSHSSFTLTRLPQWTASDSAQASVIPPKNDSEPVRVVLDRAANDWSKLRLQRGDAYPLVVEKHLASFHVGKTVPQALKFLLPPKKESVVIEPASGSSAEV